MLQRFLKTIAVATVVTLATPSIAAPADEPSEPVLTFTGGGWGPATERPATKVLDDVLDEYVSIDAAREFYGVVIDPKTMTVNEAETAKLRGIMK